MKCRKLLKKSCNCEKWSLEEKAFLRFQYRLNVQKPIFLKFAEFEIIAFRIMSVSSIPNIQSNFF